MTLEKHLAAIVFLRKSMQTAETIFNSEPELLEQFNQKTIQDMFRILDKIIKTGLL